MIFVSTVPPDIDHAPSAFQVVEGSGLILFCNASGTPKPNITWTKQRNSSELSTSETLTLPKLTREDDGSVFECTAVLCKLYINYCKFVEHTLLVCT